VREKERTGAGDVSVVAHGEQVKATVTATLHCRSSGILKYTDFFKTTSYYKLNIFQETFSFTGLSPHTRTLLHTQHPLQAFLPLLHPALSS
jgi:hypothetical protein